MSNNKYQFEFLTLDQQKEIVRQGEYIDKIIEDGFKIFLFRCENSYYVEVFMKENENEVDFISLAPDKRTSKYILD
jgi:hypothetical protein